MPSDFGMTHLSFGIEVDDRVYSAEGFPYRDVTLHRKARSTNEDDTMQMVCTGCGNNPLTLSRKAIPPFSPDPFELARNTLLERVCMPCTHVRDGAIDRCTYTIDLRERLPRAFRNTSGLAEIRGTKLDHANFLPNGEGLWIPLWMQFTPEGLDNINKICHRHHLITRPYGTLIGIVAVDIPSQVAVDRAKNEQVKLEEHQRIMRSHQRSRSVPVSSPEA